MMKLLLFSLWLVATPYTVVAFVTPPSTRFPSPTIRTTVDSTAHQQQSSTFALAAAPAKDVWILKTEQDVTKAVHKIVEDAASQAIAERGHFALAIPGGSVLKVLSSLDAGDWASKTTLAYVNHKCVPNDDLDSAIHAKVRRRMVPTGSPDMIPSLVY
jgi:hypothetical protein